MAADPTWRPDDVPPVQRQVRRWGADPCPEGATICPVEIGVELRNRCSTSVAFAVGPETSQPPDDAPINQLQPGEAIQSPIVSTDRVYLRGEDGTFIGHADPSNHVVFLEGASCDRVISSS
jgi:hypothetical protein